MKQVLAVLILTCSFFGNAQNYQPFNETSSKRFFHSNDPSDNDYFFHVDSSSIVGDSLIFNQYHPLSNSGPMGIDPSGCSFWGGSTGEVLDTSWLGNQLKWNSVTLELIAENESNELLTFDFGLAIGNSAPFYSDGVNVYSIEHTSTILESFLGVSDSVQVFTTSVTDGGGTPIPSPLSSFEIKLSKNFGLTSFINIYDFPVIQHGLEMRGQTTPSLGNYQLTYDECYPWQVNDVLQYSTYRTEGISGPPPNNAYQTVTVTDRIETADSVKLYFSSVIQELNPGTPISLYVMSTAPVIFKKGTPISEIPWNKAQGDFKLKTAVEDSVDHCGYYDQFKTQEHFSTFCDSCLCYGNFDGFGQTIEQAQYVKDYGQFKKSFTGYGPINSIPQGSATLVYSNINGVECGTLWNNIDEIQQFFLSVSPNPTKDKLSIQSDQSFEGIRVFDLMGRLIFKLDDIHQKTTEISLASLSKGAYILEASINGSIQTRTIIRE